MSNLLPRGTKVTIKVGDHADNTGRIQAVHTEDSVRPYDIRVDGTNGEIWVYGDAEVEPFGS